LSRRAEGRGREREKKLSFAPIEYNGEVLGVV